MTRNIMVLCIMGEIATLSIHIKCHSEKCCGAIIKPVILMIIKIQPKNIT